MERDRDLTDEDSKKPAKKTVHVPLGRVLAADRAEKPVADTPNVATGSPKTFGELFGQKQEEAPKREAPVAADKSDVLVEAKDASADQPIEAPEAQAESPEADGMDVEDRTYAALQLTEARAEAIAAELHDVEPDTPAAQAVAQAAAFNNGVHEQVAQGIDPKVAADAVAQQLNGEELPPLEQAQVIAETADGELLPLPEMESPNDSDSEPDDTATTGSPYVAPGGGAAGRGFAGGGAATAGSGWAGGFGRGARGGAGMAPGGPAPVEVTVVNGVASGLLVGGIIGYLLGRRRGRIRTERELLPVQRKLEREVQTLSNHLAARESQVRKLTWERATAEKRAAAPTTFHEAVLTARVEQQAATKPEAAKPAPKTAEQLHLNDVLKISETIVIGSTTIRRVYETNLISERGLRRIVDEHLRGGDIRKILTEELLLKEISHERDPLLRDRPLEDAPTAGATAHAITAIKPVSTPEPDTPVTALSAMAAESAQAHDTSREARVTPTLVIANIVALCVLAGLLILLLIIWIMR